jgi:hypothetical protein
LKIKSDHRRALPFAAFASLRLSENRRLNEEANFSPRRKGAKWLDLIFKDHYRACHLALPEMWCLAKADGKGVETPSGKFGHPYPAVNGWVREKRDFKDI